VPAHTTPHYIRLSQLQHCATRTPIHAQTPQWHTSPRPQHNELRLAQLPAPRLPTPPKMRVSRLPFIVTLVLVGTVNANVEKAVFLGPRPVALAVVPDGPPSLDALRLDTLLPVQGSSIVATQLPVQFPSVPAPRGYDAWYLLRGLQEGRRYEVRICWPATVSVHSLSSLLTPCCSASRCPSCRLLVCVQLHGLTSAQQPTDFWLHTYDISHVFDTPDLIASLAKYSEKRQEPQVTEAGYLSEHLPPATQSTLFLRVQGAASYYSLNRTLMEQPPAVDVDISRSHLPHHAST
jgi:hypothetical protein